MNKLSTGFVFLKCMPVIFQNEGGYVEHPSDPGGETNRGIARLFYPDLDIRNLTEQQTIDIYFNDYWLPMNLAGIHCEELVLHIFDFGVNTRSRKYGFNTALKTIQRLINVEADGIVGPISIAAINDSSDHLVNLYKDERKKYYFDLARRKPDLQVFLGGWINRIERTKFT